MVGIQYLAFGAAALQLVSATAVPEDWPLHLIKRQQPGTNAYNCHDNCGQAIIGSRSTGYCTNNAFTTNYANCLQCAGPDNVNIWTFYGTTLTRAGTSCGLSTTPLSGPQPDVPVAIPAAGGSVTPSSSASSSSVAPTPTPTASSTTPPTAEPTPTSGATTAPSPTTNAPSSSAPTAAPTGATTAPTVAPSSSGSAPTANTSATSVAVGAPSATGAVKPSSTVSGAPQGTGSATVPTGTVPFTGAAGSLLPNVVALFGVVGFMAVGIGA